MEEVVCKDLSWVSLLDDSSDEGAGLAECLELCYRGFQAYSIKSTKVDMIYIPLDPVVVSY